MAAFLTSELNHKRHAGLEARARGTRNREAKVTRRKAKAIKISDQVVSKRAVREPKDGDPPISEWEIHIIER
jgi:hypothetical protein